MDQSGLGHACELHGLTRMRRLLIVQRNELLRRALGRYFSLHFDQAYIAANPIEAEGYLQGVEHAISDLICGQSFGEHWPLGSELIMRWRSMCPTLERVVLVTGHEHVPSDVPGVDAVCRKPIEPTALYPLLMIPAGSLGKALGVNH